MKTLIVFGLLLLFLISAQFSRAQSVDEILEKYANARGGKEKLNSIKSIYMEGSREMMGNEVTVKITKEQGKLSRTEFEVAGKTGFFLVTEKEAWNFIPMRSPEPAKLPDSAVAPLQTELDIAGPLIDYAAKGHSATLEGKETIDGKDCYKIKLITKAGKTFHYWIDATTYLLVQSSTKGGGMFGGGRRGGGDNEILTLYKDYRDEGGILFPHSIEMKNPAGTGPGGGGTTFDLFEINKPVDPKLYKPA
ncbi:MAG: hypothetical protein QM791_11465 [Ferruginibacter sp.]